MCASDALPQASSSTPHTPHTQVSSSTLTFQNVCLRRLAAARQGKCPKGKKRKKMANRHLKNREGGKCVSQMLCRSASGQMANEKKRKKMCALNALPQRVRANGQRGKKEKKCVPQMLCRSALGQIGPKAND
jgi:hypothetical protein